MPFIQVFLIFVTVVFSVSPKSEYADGSQTQTAIMQNASNTEQHRKYHHSSYTRRNCVNRLLNKTQSRASRLIRNIDVQISLIFPRKSNNSSCFDPLSEGSLSTTDEPSVRPFEAKIDPAKFNRSVTDWLTDDRAVFVDVRKEKPVGKFRVSSLNVYYLLVGVLISTLKGVACGLKVRAHRFIGACTPTSISHVWVM